MYWRAYTLFFKKEPSNEVKANEEIQFAKSIIHPKYGIKSGKYDVNFFKKNEQLRTLMENDPERFMYIFNKLH